MLSHYMMLGLSPGATDKEIRLRYLERVKEHPPEQDPERFQDMTRAYEAIKNSRARVQSRLFECRNITDLNESLGYVARAVKPERRRAGLKELLEACGK